MGRVVRGGALVLALLCAGLAYGQTPPEEPTPAPPPPPTDTAPPPPPPPPKQRPAWKDKLYFGGGVGLSFGDIDYVELAPLVGEDGKVIASDMPLSLIVPFSLTPDLPACVFRDGSASCEAVANGDGPPLGREHEIAELLMHLRDARVRNVIWITADVHHAASIHYDPARASFKAFDPFWEFVSGPLHAGTFAPPPLDSTFGPETRYLGIPSGMKPNRPPSAGLQFFGRVRIDAATRAMTVEHWNVGGERLWSIDLPAARTAPS